MNKPAKIKYPIKIIYRGLFLLFVCFFSFIFLSQKVLAASFPFNDDVFHNIKKEHEGQQWLMVLWSVDCPACYKELALIQKLRRTNPNINVVIINTDGEEEANIESNTIMDTYQLSDIPTYFFEEGSADRNRYIIDPSWYGELPRSYFVDKKGMFNGKSGLVDSALIKRWLM